MHLLLPPSETKAAGGRGRPFGVRADDGPLSAARAAVRTALLELVAGDPATAARALALPAGRVADALRVNAGVTGSATMPALRRYTGTIYTGLDAASLEPRTRRIAERSVLVFSGLLGVVRGDEAVPDYRVPATAALPGLGTAASFWRPVLRDAVPTMLRRGLVVDLRSADYAAMWRVPAAMRGRVVTVRVLSPLPGGGYGVISYASKLAKGRLARALVERAAGALPVEAVDDVRAAWRTCGGNGERRTDTGLDLYTQ